MTNIHVRIASATFDRTYGHGVKGDSSVSELETLAVHIKLPSPHTVTKHIRIPSPIPFRILLRRIKSSRTLAAEKLPHAHEFLSWIQQLLSMEQTRSIPRNISGDTLTIPCAADISWQH